MSDRDERLTREALMAAMEVNWGRYLPTVNALTDEEQLVYARANGYDDLRSLIVHLNARFQHVLDTVPEMVAGRYMGDPEWQLDPTHAQVALTEAQTLEQVEQDFESLFNAVSGMIADLPNGAFDDATVYRWLYGIAVEHYLSHEPPGEAQIPSAQHSQVRPEPGEHVTPEDRVPPSDAYGSRERGTKP
jgi:hypothetical protein